MNKNLSSDQQIKLLQVLKTRFEKNMSRHKGLDWESVQTRLQNNKDKVWSLYQMEESGGEPDVVLLEQTPDLLFFVDCSPESPKGRRSICYDEEALVSRKENKPRDSALQMAEAMGIEILTEEQYYQLQQFGKFDLKTSSWIKTPATIRELGGALFCDRRYDQVFVYHNGAESYYAARGFRAALII